MAIRTPLSRDRVVREALALADGSGLEAVTMRRLGEELGFEAMSLYRHVSNKDDLLAGMLDLVLAEWELPVGDDEASRERIAKIMGSIPWDDHPHLAAHRDQHMAEGPHREASAFGVGLDLILGGLQKS